MNRKEKTSEHKIIRHLPLRKTIMHEIAIILLGTWPSIGFLFLCLAGQVFLYSCSERIAEIDEETDSIQIILKKEHLKVLFIGNSYTNDALSLLPTVVKNCDVDVSDMCIYKIVRGASSFKTWCDAYADKDTQSYSFRRILGGLSVPISSGSADEGDGSLFRRVLSEVEWDIIFIHQVSIFAPYYDDWRGNGTGGYLNQFLEIIKDNQPNAEIGFMLIHSYWDDYSGNKEKSSLVRWHRIADSVQELQKDYGIRLIIPYGTAIENLRQSSINNDYDLTKDGTHCGLGLCQYAAACCCFESLFSLRTGVSCYGSPANIDVSEKESQYPTINVTNSNSRIVQKAVLLAVQDMYHCNNPEERVLIR